MSDAMKNVPKRGMTQARMDLFIEHLTTFGLVGLACKHASAHAPAGGTKTFYQERKKNPEFRERWEEALMLADEAILKEMHRRGLEGWAETTAFGSVTRYSDKLLEIYGKVKSKRIRDALGSSKVEVTGVVHQADLGLGSLTPESQELLRQILENEAAKDAAE